MTENTSAIADTARTQPSRIKLSDTKVRTLALPECGNCIHYDNTLPGFGIRITAAGAKAFILNYRVKGRERRITIGHFPTWTAGKARKQAQMFRREVDLGHDPLSDRTKERSAPTVRELFERYAIEHLPTKAARSAADDRSMWRNDILPMLGPVKVSDLTPRDCDKLHLRIAADRPIRANRILEVLRKALNLAIRWGWIDRNPAIGCQKSVERKRHRFLSPDEVHRLVEALRSHSERTSADALLFMLFTGCRRGEALNATWQQFDLERQVWTKSSSETKQRREHRVPYSKAVAEILHHRRKRASGLFVFPGNSDGPLTEVRKTWKSACKTVGLTAVRVHDLRHTFASLVATSGQSLFVIGELLGHSSTQTTKRYASLYDDTLRSASEAVATTILADA